MGKVLTYFFKMLSSSMAAKIVLSFKTIKSFIENGAFLDCEASETTVVVVIVFLDELINFLTGLAAISNNSLIGKTSFYIVIDDNLL